MKKIVLMLCAVMCAVFCFAGMAAASDDWDAFVKQMEERELIRTEGPAFFEAAAQKAPEENEIKLWKLSCSAPSADERAAASAALVKKLFPDGDPSRWEEVKGFFPPSSRVPRQLVAVNALFNAVTEFLHMQGSGKYTAAWLMKEFARSAHGKIVFIDNMPAQFRETLDDLLAQVELGGSWESSKIEGPYPFVPRYDGVRTYNYALDNGLQFMDGFGGIANFGYYAWDRSKGEIYRIIDPGEKKWVDD